jgi:hypothetical protein
MSTFRFQLAVSLDGFVAGPDRDGAATCSAAGPAPGVRTPLGTAGGATTLHSIRWSSCSPTILASPWRWREGPLVPVLLGAGARLLENVGDLNLEQVRAIEAPGVTHITYRVVNGYQGRPA